MNILWDFRLFSFGYRGRGVGAYALSMAKAIREAGCEARIIIWGEKSSLPEDIRAWPVQWIDYVPRSWKSDLFIIPFIIIKYHIDIFHYWIALGPLFRMGMGLFHSCKTCVTVHDIGVEYWDEVFHCVAVRKTWYWKIQKMLLPRVDSIVCNSSSTRADVEKLYKKGIKRKIHVLYPPVDYPDAVSAKKRDARFLLLDGKENKNTKAIIEGAQQFRQKHPHYSLVLLGGSDIDNCNLEGVTFEGMERYRELLAESAGLLFCSLHEGLGLPPLEAMARHCPLVLSDIPCLRETCAEAGCFVDPRDMESIVRGMEDCALNNDEWVERSAQGALRYERMSRNAGKQWIEIYKGLV
jgi:glycosyltransferase involved in cell wall biosynthesis